MITVGVDVGGTFTDIIAVLPDGSHRVHKIPSTPRAQDEAVLRGISEILEKLSMEAEQVRLVVHGTTVATNAMIERKGARVCLITTKGLEDVLEIGRQNRTEIYELCAGRPEVLV